MKICIDAGHYGNYNQGVIKSYYEAKAMWTLTNYQKQFLLEYKDVSVVLTRSVQTKDMGLYDRGMKAKGCDLFISNHSNASDTERVDYPVVIRAFDNKNNAEVLANKLAKVIASTIGTNDAGRTWTRKHNGGEYYGVLRGARASGCPRYYILEHSFHTNKKACTWLTSDANLKKLAKAEVEAIASYYGLKKKTETSEPVTPPVVEDKPNTDFKSYIAKITADVLNVRSGPGTQYSKTGQVSKGEAYTIVDESNGWGKLKSGLGWISLEYTDKKTTSAPAPTSKTPYTVIINTDVLNVRSGPGTNYSVSTKVREGDKYTIVEEKDGWGKLKSGAGWISLEYTKRG